MTNTHIDKKIIPFLKKRNLITTRCGSTHIGNFLLGKRVHFYNGKKYLLKNITNRYYLYKPIGSLKHLNFKVSRVNKKKKKKKKKK